MKKILAVLLVLMMAFTAFACEVAPAASDAATNAAATTI